MDNPDDFIANSYMKKYWIRISPKRNRQTEW